MDLDAFYRDPHPVYTIARRTPGLTFVPELGAWLVARHADVREALSRPDLFSSAGALRPDQVPGQEALAELAKGFLQTRTVLSTDGEAHQRYRRPISRGLSPARVAAALPYVTGRVHALLDAFPDGGPVEWMAAYARPLPAEVFGHLFGLDPADVHPAVEAGRQAEALLFRPLSPAGQAGAARATVGLQHLLHGYALREPGDDLVGEMVRALTRDDPHELVSNLQNLLLAGHLTTSALLGTLVLNLLRHREQWELLCERPALIPAAIEEGARFEAPVQGFRRTVTRPCTLAGHELKEGEQVFVSYGSAGRDEAVFDRAGTFDITREPLRHLSFGHGAHACPGAQLAREQVRLTLEQLTARYPGLRLADGEVTMLPTLIHRSPEAVHLTW
ncbi:cytochrome P450 [Nonomuraea sp. NPDC003804]|uniref:cytochrome P450 n=1 Tax=Nonomuraea sp. NPDC003804 TaxID=3154547 RepID=UPI0033B87969